jgi:hypothetical protein
MPPNVTPEVQYLMRQVAMLESRLNAFERADKFYFKKNIEMPKEIGTKIGTDDKELIGFWGGTPTTQFDAPTGRGDTSGSSGTNMTTGHRFNGNTGSDYYSVGDIVYALKLCGILKNE